MRDAGLGAWLNPHNEWLPWIERPAPEEAVYPFLNRNGRFLWLSLAGEPGAGKTRLARRWLQAAESKGWRTAWLDGIDLRGTDGQTAGGTEERDGDCLIVLDRPSADIPGIIALIHGLTASIRGRIRLAVIENEASFAHGWLGRLASEPAEPGGAPLETFLCGAVHAGPFAYSDPGTARRLIESVYEARRSTQAPPAGECPKPAGGRLRQIVRAIGYSLHFLQLAAHRACSEGIENDFPVWSAGELAEWAAQTEWKRFEAEAGGEDEARADLIHRLFSPFAGDSKRGGGMPDWMEAGGPIHLDLCARQLAARPEWMESRVVPRLETGGPEAWRRAALLAARLHAMDPDRNWTASLPAASKNPSHRHARAAAGAMGGLGRPAARLAADWLESALDSMRDDGASPGEAAECRLIRASRLAESGALEAALDEAARSAAGFDSRELESLPRWRAGLARALNEVGNLNAVLGHRDEALAALRRAVPVFETLDVNQSVSARSGLAGCFNNLSVLLESFGEPSSALEYANKAMALYERLHLEFPGLFGSERLAAMNQSSRLEAAGGNAEGAADRLQKAAEAAETLAAEQSAGHEDSLAMTLVNLANHLGNLKRYYEAVESAERAARLLETSPGGDSAPSLAAARATLGGLKMDMNEPAEAAKHLVNAIKTLEPSFRDHTAAHAGLMRHAIRMYLGACQQAGREADIRLVEPILNQIYNLKQSIPD